MNYYTTKYVLTKDDESLEFSSEREACEYLGVAQCSVSSCWRNNCKCRGYSIERVGITTHNMTKTRLFKIWGAIKERCYRVKHSHYKDYGGRGISMCPEWKDSFDAFYDWAISNGYKEDLTIDRKDVNGNYEPDNCRWVTMKEQLNNKRNNHFIIVDGVKMTISQCAETYKIPKSTIRWRILHNRNVITGVKMQEEENA